MAAVDDFSTNRHSVQIQGSNKSGPIRYPDLCFEDGNLAILTGDYYFLVHEGLLRRHSEVLDNRINALGRTRLLEGRPVLLLDDAHLGVAHFLQALYDGMCVTRVFGRSRYSPL
jgi:hypothetical protein